jgi:hypothetical protein
VKELILKTLKEILDYQFGPEELLAEDQEEDTERYGLKDIIIDGNRFEIATYKAMSQRAANYLIEQGKLKQSEFPIKFGGENYLISLTPIHPDGESFRT